MNKLVWLAILISSISVFAQERVPTEELVEGIKSSDGRWFEVEVILFKRNDNSQINEHFSKDVKSLERRKQWDLIRRFLNPDLSLLLNKLPECHTELNPFLQKDLSGAEFFQYWQLYQEVLYDKWQFTNQLCLMPNESLSGIWRFWQQPPEMENNVFTQVPEQDIPVQVTAGDHDDFHDVYLIGDKNLKLVSHFNKLKQLPDVTPILHTGWRLPGLSKARSLPMYIVAGKNYSNDFRYDGYPIIRNPEIKPIQEEIDDVPPISQDTPLISESRLQVNQFMDKLKRGAKINFQTGKLENSAPRLLPEHSYELDGFIKVHLNHYLYLDAQFNYRELSNETINLNELLPKLDAEDTSLVQTAETSDEQPNNEQVQEDESYEFQFLKTYQFDQTRRLYSGDLHYLDHPKIGVLVQIRKYRH
jgi:hypothetical protein